MTDDLITSLRALAAAQHSDLSVAADAASEIQRLTRERDEARAEVERQRAELDRTREQLNAAVTLLAEWCDAVDKGGASWDYWDNHYKEARWGKGVLRYLIDAEIAKLEAKP